MGIYETLYAFQAGWGKAMGEPGSHPWSQGYPLTKQLPGGPPMPERVEGLDWTMRRYPKAWGLPKLREMIAKYYNKNYGSNITSDNVMIYAGGRPSLITIFMFMHPDIRVTIGSTEYTPYYDMLEGLNVPYDLVESNAENRFNPPNADFFNVKSSHPAAKRTLALISNPCNPTGVTRKDSELEDLIRLSSREGNGLLIDEAYELFHSSPVSALQYIKNIDDTNIFVTGAATKGLQAPGIRIGWCVASRANIETMGNYSSFGMGGVPHLSQMYACELLEEKRVELVRKAVPEYYQMQRQRYGEALSKLGVELFTGEGGFYHWGRLPHGLSGEELNQRLFKDGAAILRGTDCDMRREGANSTLNNFFRFSFGPLEQHEFEGDVKILERALGKK